MKEQLYTENLKKAFCMIKRGVRPTKVGRNSLTKKCFFVFDQEEIKSNKLMYMWINWNDILYEDTFKRSEELLEASINAFNINISKEEVVIVYNPQQAYFYVEQGLVPLQMVEIPNRKIAFVFNKRKSNPIFSKWLEYRNCIKNRTSYEK